MSLLEVHELAVSYASGVDALRGVTFSLDRGEALALTGETGSGKTTLALSLAGLVQPPAARGSVRVESNEVLGASGEELRQLRWATVAVGLQGAPFNPVVTIGDQIAEPLRDRLGLSAGEARARAADAVDEVALAPALLGRYPHELSGGEKRRAMLAMALILDPALLVLDEPTAGLDPVTRGEVIDRLHALRAERGFALLIISHDLPGAAQLAERTMVLYGGKIVEAGGTPMIVGDPAHPYTWGLVSAYPVMSTTKDLRPIRGTPPDPRTLAPGCPFFERCTQAVDRCFDEMPPLEASRGRLVACHFGGLKTLLSAQGIAKGFGRGAGRVQALQEVSMTVREGESVGVIGPSGSGKSTLARLLTGHLDPDAGTISIADSPLGSSWSRSSRELRRRVQLVMQDPWDALSPRLTVRQLVREPLDIAGTDGRRRDGQVGDALATVGLPSTGAFLEARTHELSGGQLQRVALARALVAGPKLLVADEPTSMLDASEQARLLVVLRERQVEMGLALVLVSHDIALVRKVTDRIVVLEGGRVVEEGPSHTVSTAPRTTTARRLIGAAPTFGGDPLGSRAQSTEEEGRTHHETDKAVDPARRRRSGGRGVWRGRR